MSNTNANFEMTGILLGQEVRKRKTPVSTFRDAAATAGLKSSVNTASYSPAFTVRMHMD